jgi:hypothetical protein
LTQVGNAEHKADGVQNVALSTAIQTSNGIELGIPLRNDCSGCIRLEAFQHDFLNEHDENKRNSGTAISILFYKEFIFFQVFTHLANIFI